MATSRTPFDAVMSSDPLSYAETSVSTNKKRPRSKSTAASSQQLTVLGRDRLVKKKAPTPIQPSSPPVEESSDESEADDSDDEDDDEDVTTKGLLEDINRALQQHIRRQDKKIRNLERKVDYLIGILTQPSDPIPPEVNLKSWNTWAE